MEELNGQRYLPQVARRMFRCIMPVRTGKNGTLRVRELFLGLMLQHAEAQRLQVRENIGSASNCLKEEIQMNTVVAACDTSLMLKMSREECEEHIRS